MFIGDVRRIWLMSAFVFSARHLSALIRRGQFVARSLIVYGAIKPILHADPQSVLGKLMRDRPETIGILIWPYQCVAWTERTRLTRLVSHCDAVGAIGQPANLGVKDKVCLGDLSHTKKDLYIILDQPIWFMREGNLVVNLFVGRVRMYSLAFSLIFEEFGLTAVVGAIQGRDIEGALEEYRNLTKAAHGMRPRDLLFEIFRMLCTNLGVTRAIAVSDEGRHHRHAFFGSNGDKQNFSNNYNEIWLDRGGERIDEMFFRLDISQNRRELTEIAPKKRSMYRRRYEMLDTISRQLTEEYSTARAANGFAPCEGFDL